MIRSVRVIGLGKVGELIATLLQETGFDVRAYDVLARVDLPFPTASLDVRDPVALRAALIGGDAVVSCLPYTLNLGVAEAAYDTGVHYFDLTEDVSTTYRVKELADKSGSLVFAPQCGLAPGLIGMVGTALTRHFDVIRSIELKVGALPRHPTGLLGYAFNWSPEGVVNEYLNDCEVLRGGIRQMVPAMTESERVCHRRHRAGGVADLRRARQHVRNLSRAGCNAWTTRPCATRGTSSSCGSSSMSSVFATVGPSPARSW